MDYRACYIIVRTADQTVETHQVKEQTSTIGVIKAKIWGSLTEGPAPSEVTVTFYDADGEPTELVYVEVKNRFPVP